MHKIPREVHQIVRKRVVEALGREPEPKRFPMVERVLLERAKREHKEIRTLNQAVDKLLELSLIRSRGRSYTASVKLKKPGSTRRAYLGEVRWGATRGAQYNPESLKLSWEIANLLEMRATDIQPKGQSIIPGLGPSAKEINEALAASRDEERDKARRRIIKR